MKIGVFPRDMLEEKWKLDLKQFDDPSAPPPNCLRCGKPLNSDYYHNKLCRYIPVTICCACGDDEAIRTYSGTMLPFEQWHAVTSGSIKADVDPQTAFLTPVCNFGHIFESQKSEAHNGTQHPVNLVAYSRSDYDGYRWYTTWFDGPAGRPSEELVKEIDAFQNALFELPEMVSLTAMNRLHFFAEPTNEKTEYNLYSETEHFHIWLRLIYRQKDYNLRVHYYSK